MQFTGNRFVAKSQIFSDDDTSCARMEAFLIKWEGSFVIGDPIQENPSIRALDFVISEFDAVYLDSNQVIRANALQVLGFSDWVLGTPKTLFGLELDGVTVNENDVVYDIFSTENGELRTSDEFAQNESSRPTQLSEDTVLMRTQM